MIGFLYLLSVVVSFLTVRRSRAVYGTYWNHYFFFNAWWLGTLFLTFDSPNYPPIHELTYMVFLGGLLVFNITILFLRPVRFNLANPRKEVFFNIRHRRYIELFVFICYLPLIKDNVISLMHGNAFWLIRKEFFERESSYMVEAIMAYICRPLSSILFITAYYKYYTNLKKHSYTFNIIISVFLVLCSCFSTGGRTVVINFIVLYVIMCFCYSFGYYKDVLNKNAKFNPLLLAIPVCGVLFITLSRNLINEKVSLWELLQFSYGLYGGLLDYYLWGDGRAAWPEYTYGLSTFEGVYLFVNYYVKIFFSGEICSYIPVDNIIQEPVFLIDNDFPVNAHVSMYFRFIRDWGWAGVIIGPIMMSLLFHWIFRLGAKKQVHLLFYFYMLMQINYTTFDNGFSKNYFVMFIFWYLILTKFTTKTRYVDFTDNSGLQC